jgi:3-(3-hydroxy-phenyl)propionate hydroxylase
MDDVIGTGWRVVLAAHASVDLQQAAASKEIAARVVQLGTPELTEADGLLAQWFATHNTAAAIVRPDHYVYGVCQNAHDLSEQLGRLGALLATTKD